jgi:tripartite-type tricarboxylate transporter receptor subunit TctC
MLIWPTVASKPNKNQKEPIKSCRVCTAHHARPGMANSCISNEELSPRRQEMKKQNWHSRRRLLAACALGAAMALSAGVAIADDYPSKPVRIIVPFAAGGPADVYARFVAQRLQDALKQTFLIDNRPGGGSIIGTDAVAKSASDGYTLLMMSNTHTVNESLFATKPFQLMRDFAPIAPINYSDLVLVTKPDLPVNSLGDLLKLAKAKPGSLTYASSGPGTPYHMAGELFKTMAGVNILHVPYKGSSGARTDVLGGQVDMMFDAVPTMAEFIRQGKVKALGTTGKSRSAAMPDLPTVSEAGVPGYEAVIWLGMMAPKNTPPDIINRLNAEITKVTSDPEVVQSWAKKGAAAMKMSPEEFTKFLNEDIAKWAYIVKISGAKADR